MLNKEGQALLRAVIARQANLQQAVKEGNCKAIAAGLNSWFPPELRLSEVDVYNALKGSEGFGMPKHNAEVLRERIVRNPVLYSALVNGDAQTIANELNLSPYAAEQVTVADVKAALEVKPAPKPENVSAGAATMTGSARMG